MASGRVPNIDNTRIVLIDRPYKGFVMFERNRTTDLMDILSSGKGQAWLILRRLE